MIGLIYINNVLFYPRFEISVNTDILVLEFYGYIGKYFDKNIQNLWECLKRVEFPAQPHLRGVVRGVN